MNVPPPEKTSMGGYQVQVRIVLLKNAGGMNGDGGTVCGIIQRGCSL